MISDFKVFPVILLRQLNFGISSVYQPFYVYYKGKTPLFFNLQFLFLLTERGLSPEFTIRGLVVYELVPYKKISVVQNKELGKRN